MIRFIHTNAPADFFPHPHLLTALWTLIAALWTLIVALWFVRGTKHQAKRARRERVRVCKRLQGGGAESLVDYVSESYIRRHFNTRWHRNTTYYGLSHDQFIEYLGNNLNESIRLEHEEGCPFV